MKNFIFISPNFPTNYWQFCRELKKNGLNVLGIGDQPYDELMPQLHENLTEYYKVTSLENYDEVYRAVAFFTFKYGRIDFIESNNEYWLEQDARLRTDFNIRTGFQVQDLPRIKYKSKMKEYYRRAGIPVARWVIAESIGVCLDFIRESRALYPRLQYVVLSFHEGFEYVQSALRLGALDYISKLCMEEMDCTEIFRRVGRLFHFTSLP